MRRQLSKSPSLGRQAGIALVEVITAVGIVGTLISDGAERGKVAELQEIASQYTSDINDLIAGCRGYAKSQADSYASCATSFANVSASPHLSNRFGDGTTASPRGTAYTFTGSTRTQIQVNATFQDAAVCQYNQGVWIQAGYASATCTGTNFTITSAS